MAGLFSILLKNVEIHALEKEMVLTLCNQTTCTLDKYFIKKYVVSLFFTQYVLCENPMLVSTMILFGSSKMVSKFLDNKQDTYCK